MILLTSDGITSPQLEEEIKKALVPISRRAALVTTASCRYKEKDHNVPVLSALMRRFGLEPECVDVEFQDATFLLAYDVVILMGGNPFYLRKHLKKWKNSLEVPAAWFLAIRWSLPVRLNPVVSRKLEKM